MNESIIECYKEMNELLMKQIELDHKFMELGKGLQDLKEQIQQLKNI